MSTPEPEASPALQLRCPLCGSESFVAFNGRENARCAVCKSVERNRLVWMVLDAHGLFRPGQRVLHFAPEFFLARRFAELSGDLYHACDVDPERYGQRTVKVRRFDLCTDLEKLPSRSFDLILHCHVLEHLCCDVEQVLRELERILAPGGRHIMSVPIRGETTLEDLSDDLLPQHRTEMFGQDDHFRIFGTRDLGEMLKRVWGEDEDHLVEPLKLFTPEALTIAAIPPQAWTGWSSHSLLMHQRPLQGGAGGGSGQP
jgi:SAM-dependent methyltransferase